MAKTSAHQKYTLKDGTIVPGVTTVINAQLAWNKNTLIAWARKQAMEGKDPTKVRDKAAEIGTLAHYLIECHLRGIEYNVEEYSKADLDKAENAFLAFLEFEKQNNYESVFCEKQIVSEIMRTGGTIDWIAKKGNDLILIDFKTSSGVYPEHYVQVAVYFNMAKENGIDIKTAKILQIGKEDGALSVHDVSPEKILWGNEVFRLIRPLHDLQKR